MNIFGVIQEVYKIFRMNLRNRYLGSKLGILWAIVQPLLTMSIYVFIFGIVFQTKVEGSDSSFDYVIWFLCGFIPWMAINEGILTSANSVISGINLVKNFAIRSDFLPISAALMGLPQMLVGLVVIILLSFISGLGLSWHIVWLFVIVPLLYLLVMGVGFFLSALSVFVRDLIQMLPTLLHLLFYATPIFYGIETFPGVFAKLTFFNPVYQICNSFRRVLFLHENPDVFGLVYIMILIALLWTVGRRYFRKLSGFFESAL